MDARESVPHPPGLSDEKPPPVPAAITKKEAEIQAAEAVVDELALAPQAEKRQMAVDHRLVMQEVQLLLAEKRTSYALLRTGITVSLVPLSLWTVLLATSQFWNALDALWFVIPFAVGSALLFLLGVYLVSHALLHIAHTEHVIAGLRRSDTLLEDMLLRHGRAARLLAPWRWRTP